jgi:hypothetical protein
VEASLIKYDVLRDHNMVGGMVKAEIPFVIWGITDEDTPCGTGSKLMWGCHGKVGVASTPKDLKMPIGRCCVVYGSVRAQSSYGFFGRRLCNYGLNKGTVRGALLEIGHGEV